MAQDHLQKVLLTAAVLFVFLSAGTCGRKEDGKKRPLRPEEEKFMEFLAQHEKKVKPLYREANEADWKAKASGKEEDYTRLEELQIELEKIYSNREEFKLLNELKESEQVQEPLLKRQLRLLFLKYLENQIPPDLAKEIVKKESEISRKFHTFRAEIDGKKVTDNEIKDILAKELDPEKRKKAWEASKQVGRVVADDILELVGLRNKAAKAVGSRNYYVLALKLAEQKEGELVKFFGELKRLTDEAFREVKAEIDLALADRYGIEPQDLRPWHYEDRFFQEAPNIYSVDLDQYYRDKDVVEITQKFYSSIGLPVEEILGRSDLYERENKYQHAYCTHIDREGDVRIMANVRPDIYWMETMLHECGHAVYDKYMNRKLPFFLRTPSHSLTTEAIAQLFGRLARNPHWMEKVLGITEEERETIAPDIQKTARLQQLVFCRWALVMFGFERILYNDPKTDLVKLWWDHVQRLQELTPPEDRNEPDWAAKIHVATVPVYYHNYLLGELLASQVHFHIANNVVENSNPTIECYAGNPAVSKYLKEKIFAYGALYPWDQLIEKATGLELSPKFYSAQFVREE